MTNQRVIILFICKLAQYSSLLKRVTMVLMGPAEIRISISTMEEISGGIHSSAWESSSEEHFPVLIEGGSTHRMCQSQEGLFTTSVMEQAETLTLCTFWSMLSSTEGGIMRGGKKNYNFL